MLRAIAFMTIIWAATMGALTPTILRRLPSLLSSPNVGWWVLALYGLVIMWGIVDVEFLSALIRKQFTHGGRGPVKVVVGSDGIHFFWAMGKSRLEPWQGVRFPIVIHDFSKAAGHQARIKVARDTSFALTGEAVHGIVAEANRLGLQTTSFPTSDRTGTQGTLITISRECGSLFG